MPSDRRPARWVAGALLGVVAVALAAATLNSTVSDSPGGRTGGPPGEEPGFFPIAKPPLEPAEGIDVPFLGEILTALFVAAVLLAVAYALVERREALKTLVTMLVVLGVVYLLIQALASLSGGGASSGLPLGGQADRIGGGGDSATGAASLPVPPAALVAVLGLALAVVVAAALRSAVGRDDDEPVGASEGEAAAVGRAAGRAAERIREGTAADNEVYRAWREMTERLDVANPASSTPREFETAAVEAGMAREDVAELTDLFESVRYGGTEPSDPLEERAVAAFERIEATYAEEPEEP